MCIDHAGEGQSVLAIIHGFGADHVYARGHQGHRVVGNRNVGIKHHVAVWAYHSGVFNQQIEFRFALGFPLDCDLFHFDIRRFDHG